VALRYAVARDVLIHYHEAGNLEGVGEFAQGAIHGRTKAVDIAYTGKKSIAEFFDTVGHEIKHRRQMDTDPQFSRVHHLRHHVNLTNASGVYGMARTYRVPSVVNAATVHGVIEFDANTFGSVIQIECTDAFKLRDPPLKLTRERMSSNINRFSHIAAIQGMPAADRYVENDLIASYLTMYSLKSYEKTFGRLPHIAWIPVTPVAMQKMVGSFWKDAGYRPPFDRADGLVDLKGWQARTAAHPQLDVVLEMAEALYPAARRTGEKALQANA